MLYKKTFVLVVLFFFVMGVTACNVNTPDRVQVQEIEVQFLTLGAPINTPNAEVSGLSWAGDWLIFLPQYPQRFGNQVFRIHKETIVDAIKSHSTEALVIEPVAFDSDGLEKQIRGFEGFEAIAVNGWDVYLTIESDPGQMMGYAVQGVFSEDFKTIHLDGDTLVELPPRADLDNYSDESVLVFGRRVLTFYEANGENVNPEPNAYLLSLDLALEDTMAFPTIEYRVTDASRVDEQGRFWVINYMFPGDEEKLDPAEDAYVQQFGEGESHSQSDAVERLLELQFTEDGIVPSGEPPIALVLLENNEARNWEGLVRLDDLGFLLVTDTFPDTLLGFVPFP